MYCSTCGVNVAPGLSYCNYCGAKFNGEKGDSVSKSSAVRPEFLVSAMIGLFVFRTCDERYRPHHPHIGAGLQRTKIGVKKKAKVGIKIGGSYAGIHRCRSGRE